MAGPSGISPAGGVEISYGEAGYKGLIREPYIFFLACFASIGGVLFGYDQGVISGVLVMNNFAKQFPLLASDETLQGWMVAVLTLGAMFGALINGPIADRLSRRWSILLANIIFLIGSIIQAAAVNIPMIFVGRFIAGLSVGQLSMVVPLYLSELAPPNLRGSLVAMQQLGITVGIMVAFWLDYGTQHIGGTGDGQSPAAWRFPLAFQCVPSVILGAGTFFLPYSPRWLVMGDREEEARATLIRIRRVPATDDRIRLELLEIKAAALFDQQTTAAMYPGIESPVRIAFERYKSLFTVRINAIIYYAPQIFRKIGLSGNSIDLLATGVVGVINFFSTIPAIMFMDRWGRKKVLLIGAVGMSISQLIVGTIYAVYRDTLADHPAAGWASAVFIWLYISNFAFSIGCVNWIMPSEIFPPGVRSQAVGVAIGTNWLSNVGFCLFLGVWVFFFVPETKGVRIEEMDKLFGGNQGVEDMERIANIRLQLGIVTGDMEKDNSGHGISTSQLNIDAALANLDTNGEANPPAIDFEDAQTQIETDRDQPAHEFEWHETSLPLDSGSPAGDLRIKDGMATLSTLDAGYLGSSSGSNLLQEIASMLPELATPSVSSDHHSTSPGTWRSRRAPENILDPPGLASSAITGHLIDAYFLFYNVSYPILHERTFREKVASRQQRRCKSSWNVIYFMVLAFGHWISTTDAHHEQSKYYSAARSYLSIQMLESGTVETVQAFLLMGNYLQKIDRPNTGYNFVGIAYKMALGLGMHRETPGVEDNIGHERRRQLFWTVYCFDSGFNITTGRPPNVSEGVVDTQIPRNIQDKAQLARLANVLYHEFLLAKTANAKLEYQVAEATERNLVTWRQTLPSYFTSPDVPTWFLGPRAVVLWKEQNLRIILWRGSTRYHSFLPSKMDAEKRCLEVAMQSIHDIAAFCSAYDGILHLGIAWYATYFLFQAALVLEASYLDKENQQRSDDETAIWQVVVAEARECLVILAQKSKSASRCLEVLDLIHRRTQARNIIGLDHTASQPGQILEGYQQQLPVTGNGEAVTLAGAGGECAAIAVNEFGLYDDTSDLTLRMILDQTPWGYLDNTPMDAMFNDWIYPQFELQTDS
ncbi:hypothetical protein G7Z17_g5846 [Cylindrodendrum hubeiense]|uniref:Major facilitator superfamily (MFS) profile domain-containing protein n=1 Tax=Cylindrodendrum hubeiense TaxID=595255 RepID=A0A9P5HC57_9HYPO|nr:hypothetical protein G7Z17_g5846 [Cylindrodendrum hubeiense]